MVALQKGGVRLTHGQPPTIVVRSGKTEDHVMLTPRDVKALANMIGN